MRNFKFTESIERTIRKHRLLQKGERVLVALSGGADSVALACVLQELGYTVSAAHCNFHLRGTESDRDERFVRDFCMTRGIPLEVRHFDTLSYAKEHAVSVEMAARDLRYGFFDEMRKQWDIPRVAVAHHREDDAETVLLNMLRGTGIRGMRGILFSNGPVVRPLLDVSRGDIEAYLLTMGQGYVVDSTNLQDDVTRNKIRLNVMPLLREINPSVEETLHQNACRCADAVQLYDFALGVLKKELVCGNRIDIAALLRCPAPSTILYEILADMNFNSAQVQDVYEHLDGESGKVYESETHRLLRDRNVLVFEEKKDRPMLVQELPQEGEITLSDGTRLLIHSMPFGGMDSLVKDCRVACLDLEKLEWPLVVRPIREGDRFVPLGMKGSKLLLDFLTDRKKNRFEKERQWVVCSGERIVWVVGERIDHRFRATENTQRILQIEVSP